MSAIESETRAVTAAPTGAEAPQSRPPERGGPETNSRPRRQEASGAPHATFRGFLEQLGENPRESDPFRRRFWSCFYPEGTHARKTWCPQWGKRDRTSGLPRRDGWPRRGVGGEVPVAGPTEGDRHRWGGLSQ